MNQIDLINKIKDIALSTKYVNSVYDIDVYTAWNIANVRYGSVVVNIESINYDVEYSKVTYNILAYYGDRLLQDNSNVLEVQSDANNVFYYIMNKLYNEYDINIEGVGVITPFSQKFADLLAGSYIRFSVETNCDIDNCTIGI